MNSFRTTPGANQDVTERVSTFDVKDLAYSTPITVVPTKKRTLVRIATLTGALTINLGVGSTTNPPNAGDEITVLFAGDATGRTVTFGTGIAPNAATLVLAAGSKKGAWTGVFDGAIWVESGRSTQA